MPFPGPQSQALLTELRRYVITDPWPFAVDLDRCQGMTLATLDGQRLTDWGGMYGSRLLGYRHPRLLAPDVQARLARAATTRLANPDFLTPECVEYYRAIHGRPPRGWDQGDHEVYVVNSGAEAVENTLKYLLNLHDRKRGLEPGTQVPRRFLRFEGAFHGRTVFALNLTGLAHAPVITRDFHGLVSHIHTIPFPALDSEDPRATAAAVSASLAAITAVLEAHPGEVVALLAEPLQGAGGQRVAGPDFWPRASALLQAHDAALAFDEVQTAGGPCGAFWASDLLGLSQPPQALAAAKKLGNGVVMMRHPMTDEGVLDSTWGGSLPDMVRVLEELAIVDDEDLVAQIPAKAAHLTEGLHALARRAPAVLGQVRGLGVYQGFSLRDPAATATFVARARDEAGLFLLTAGPGVIRLRPPMDVTHADIDRLLAGLSTLL